MGGSPGDVSEEPHYPTLPSLTYVTAHSPIFPSLHLSYSSFYTFRCFTYDIGTSPTSPSEPPMPLWWRITGMAIGSKLLSGQPARDGAEHAALRNAVRLKSMVVRVNTEQLHIYITLHQRFSNCGTEACDFYMVREQLSTEHLKKTPYIHSRV